jgi:ubiquinone/menaquinone biosynthesis C-methylase UbiE
VVSSLFQVPGGLPDRFAYRAQQASLLQIFLALNRRFGILRDNREADVETETLNAAWRRYSALLERDILNVRERLYPRELLFEIPLRDYLAQLPRLLKNTPRVMLRRVRRDFMDLPRDVDLASFPPYYRQNFHWQTDGYLSRGSAELYDVGVEMLFFGTADVMRRQIIPPVTRFLDHLGASNARLLDVGCGTGRTMIQLAETHPILEMIGVDMSPFYIEVARERFQHERRVQLMTANAEDLPFKDEYFDVVTSVFTMHELPRAVRRRVLSEIRRVLRPGGLLVIEDSAQMREAQDLAYFMHAFAQEFHEPYYEDYIVDDLTDLLTESGFSVDRVESHFVAKLVAGRKIQNVTV